MWKRLGIAWWALVLVATACGPERHVATQAVASEPAPAIGSVSAKSITLAVPEPVKGFGVWTINTAGGSASVWELHSMGLVTNDESGKLVARLATRLPSLADGSIVLLPDGRMQTTWVLRPGVKWQDGVPLTAEDLAFGSEVGRDPEIPGEKSPSGKYIEEVEARDPQTAVTTWKAPFFRANALTLRELWPMPSHLMRDAFRADRKAFMNLPYWTTDYVHLGPFRLVDYGLGETLVFERFDEYFLGRPKLQRVVLQTIRDPNATFAGIRAGAVDMTTELSFPPDLGARLRDEWATTGEGVVLQRQGAWRYLKVRPKSLQKRGGVVGRTAAW